MRYPELCGLRNILTKRFPHHLYAQTLDALELIMRPLIQLTEIGSLYCRKIDAIAASERQRSFLPVIPSANPSSA